MTFGAKGQGQIYKKRQKLSKLAPYGLAIAPRVLNLVWVDAELKIKDSLGSTFFNISARFPFTGLKSQSAIFGTRQPEQLRV